MKGKNDWVPTAQTLILSLFMGFRLEDNGSI